MTIQRSKTIDKQKEIPDKVKYPTRTYTRNEFYKTTDDVRYYIKLNLFNGQEAKNVNVGIEDLIEFLGDIHILIESTDEISINHREHTYWTAKLNTEETMLNNISTKKLENNIENIAKEHGLALYKEIGMSGRGYDDSGFRVVNITYSFGVNKKDPEKAIQDSYLPTTNTEWVGGSIGQQENLNESSIEIKSVESKNKFEVYLINLKRKIRKII